MSARSLEAAITTPRLKISERGEIIEEWLCIIQRIIFSYMCSVPDQRYLVKIYIKKLENDDIRMAALAKRKSRKISFGSRKFRSNRSKESLLETNSDSPAWLQKIVCAKYPTLGKLSDESKSQYKNDILGLTDLDIIYTNVEVYGGGRGRSPVGTFTESASQFFTTYLSESHHLEDQILLKIWNAFAAIKATSGSLKVYQEKRGRTASIDSNRFDTPLSMLEQIITLTKQVNIITTNNIRIVTDSEDLSDLAGGIERLIKDVGVNIIRLTEILSINKGHYIANIWKEFQIFCDNDDEYEILIKQVFKCIKIYLQVDMSPMTEHVTILDNYLQEIASIRSTTTEIDVYMSAIRKHFNDPIRIFNLGEIYSTILRLKRDMRDILSKINENDLNLNQLNRLSNLFDSFMSCVETLSSLLESRQGDKTILVDFYVFVERWKVFYNKMSSVEKKLILNYAFEYNLHQAWMFIEQTNHNKKSR